MTRLIYRGSIYVLMILFFAACSQEMTGPEPELSDSESSADDVDASTDPAFLCNEDAGTWVTLVGEDFSPLVIDAIASESDSDVELPMLTFTLSADPTGAQTDEIFGITLESPLGADDGSIRWIDSETLQFYVSEELEFPPGVYDLVVTNPNGTTSSQSEAFGILPRPTLEAAIPEMTCVAQGERLVRLEGADILILGDEYPTVEVDGERFEVVEVDDCHDLHSIFGGHQLCAEATARIDEASLEPGTYPVTLENLEPAGCTSNADADDVNLTITPPPVVDDIQPSPICGEQLDYEAVEVTGQGFIVLGEGEDRIYPEVRVGSQSYQPEGADGCESVDEAPSMFAERCTQLTVSIAAGDLSGQIDDEELVTQLDVTVENPEPVGCHSVEDTSLGVVPPPTLAAVTPRAICNNDESVIFDVEGEHLFEVDGIAPELIIDGETYETTASDCTDIEGEDGTRACATLEVDVNPANLDGVTTMVAVNPAPMACESADSEPFYAAGPPLIASAEPDGFCEDETFDGELSLSGPFVFDPAGEQPVVSIDGTPVDIDDFFGCSSLIDDLSLDSCEGINLTIPEELIDEEFMVTVTAPDPVACGADSIILERTSPPTIEAVIPGRVCSEGSTFTVMGTGIHEDAEFLLNGLPADETDVAADGTSATVTFTSPVGGSFATLDVINPGDCGSTYTEELRVTDGPLPVFVDPPVVFDEMNTQVTIYAAGLYGGTIDEVELIHPDGTTTVLEHTYDNTRPAVVQATIPENVLAGLDAADFNDGGTTADFGIRLTDQEITCSNEAPDLVTITSELTVAIESIDPPFGAQDQSTGVEISAATELEDGEVQFAAVPRAYLNPVDDANATAREIRSVQFISETSLNGIVPSELPVGFYDVIIVNPDGAVGILDGGFQITEERPPLVDGVSPGSWETGEAALQVDIEGQNFRDDPEDPTVQVFCQESGSDETDEALLNQPASIDVVSVTDTLVEIVVNTSGLSHLDACYMRLTNADGTYDEYSPITVTNPSGNFVEFQAGSEFHTARRGPTLFSGVPSRAARYLYVVGGDDGLLDGTYSSGEFARLNRFGAPQSWDDLPYDLPSGRTLANGLRIDDFVYLVGGYDEDEEGPSNQVLRAQILDPLDSPEIVGLDLDVEEFLELPTGQEPDGLSAGTYYYRVSAVYDSGDPANPEGESLASEPQPLSLPVDGVTLTISWVPPADINHEVDYYRVYRSVAPNDPYGDESLIYETADAGETSFEDDGSIEPIAGDNPLRLGSLGIWHQVATLNHGRMVAGITSAVNPANPDEHFIYAIGGEDSDEAFRADYEFVSIDVNGPRDQDVFDAVIGQFEDDDMLLPEGRAEFQAVTAHESNASAVSNVAPQVFTIAGQTTGGGGNNTYVATVGTDGHLEQWTQTTAIIGAAKRGHAATAINNNLAVAGGSNGDPSTQAYHSEITCDGGCPPAEADGWVSLSNVNMQDRVWMGSLTFRGFWYLAGGLTTGNVPSNTVDFSVAGGAP